MQHVFFQSHIHSRENQTLAEVEQMLQEHSAGSSDSRSAANSAGVSLWRIIPIVLLAGVGAAFALMPTSLKDALMTGRSVAHTPTDR